VANFDVGNSESGTQAFGVGCLWGGGLDGYGGWGGSTGSRGVGGLDSCWRSGSCDLWTTNLSWTFECFIAFNNLFVFFWFTHRVRFAFKNWATGFFVGAGTEEFRTDWTFWGWSGFTNSRLASTFISSFNNHLAWPARSDLDGWTKSINANHLSRATALSTFDEADSFLNLTFGTLDFFNLWAIERFFVATFTRKTFLGWTTVIVQTVFISSRAQKFTFLTF
jgi:hypothetical protein